MSLCELLPWSKPGATSEQQYSTHNELKKKYILQR